MHSKLTRSRWGTLFVMSVIGLLLSAQAMVAQFPSGRPPKPRGTWMDRSLSPDKHTDLILAQMTLDKMISLVHAAWRIEDDHPATGGTAPLQL